eukprot:2401977-Karenia_brevis.AAC.2
MHARCAKSDPSPKAPADMRERPLQRMHARCSFLMRARACRHVHARACACLLLLFDLPCLSASLAVALAAAAAAGPLQAHSPR